MKKKRVGFGPRFLAYFIDTLILGLLTGALSTSMVFRWGEHGRSGTAWLPGALVAGAYFIFFWVKQNGQTLGKRFMALKVVKENGKSLDWETAVLRYIGYLISSFVLGLGFLWVAFDKKKQGWHDKIAKTKVVRTSQKPKTKIVVLILVAIILVSLVAMSLVGFGFFKLWEAVKENPGRLRKFEEAIEEFSFCRLSNLS